MCLKLQRINFCEPLRRLADSQAEINASIAASELSPRGKIRQYQTRFQDNREGFMAKVCARTKNRGRLGIGFPANLIGLDPKDRVNLPLDVDGGRSETSCGGSNMAFFS
jgi:hypothetical protein